MEYPHRDELSRARAPLRADGRPARSRRESRARRRSLRAAASDRAERLARRLADESLDDDGVAPLAVEPAVSSVRADLAEADLREELAARLVLGEDAREELPYPAAFTFADERVHRGAARSGPPRLARDIDGELGNTGVARPRSVLARGRPRDHAPLALDDDGRPALRALAQATCDVVGRPGLGLERGKPIGDPFVVDARDRQSILDVRDACPSHSAGWDVGCCASAGPIQIVCTFVNSRAPNAD